MEIKDRRTHTYSKNMYRDEFYKLKWINPYIYMGLKKQEEIIKFLELVNIIQEKTGVNIHSIRQKTRKTKIREARQLLCYLCYQYTNKPLQELEKLIGVDHATILHSKNTVLLDYSERFKQKNQFLKEITDKLDIKISENMKKRKKNQEYGL